MKIRKKRIFFISIILILIIILFRNMLNTKTKINQKIAVIPRTYNSNISVQTDISNIYKAFQEVCYSYYMRGPNIQYHSMKVGVGYFSPEESTSQNMNYMVCSGLTRNVYSDLLGIQIPHSTTRLLDYGGEFIGNSEVIAYGNRDSNNNTIMKLYDENAENNYITLTNPSISDILPYLKCGDILTYTGHTMLIYDLIYDENGNVIDAYIMESQHGNNTYHVITKIPKLISIGDNIKFGSSNPHYLYHNSSYNTTYDDGLLEGSIHLSTLKTVSVWKSLATSKKEEYSILRFISEDDDGNVILTYHGKDYQDSEHNGEIINLLERTKDRLKFSRLYIEKTVDAYADSVVEANDELTYTIVIKNNSDKAYDNSITVTENISDYVTYKSSEVSKDTITFNENLANNKIEWNIGKLSSGEEVTINYTVAVKEHCNGQVIESTGTVENIPSSIVKNTISYNLTDDQANSIIEKYNDLSRKYNGKEFINELYKQALGIDLQIDKLDITNLVKNTKPTSTLYSTISLNSDNALYNMVLNKYYNALAVTKYPYEDKDIYAYDIKNWHPYTDQLRRADTINSENLKTGDILIYTNDNDVTYNYTNNTVTTTPVTYESGEYAYIYIEGQGFVGVNFGNDGIAGTQDDRNEFNSQYYIDNGLNVYSNTNETDENILEFTNYQTLFGKDYYVILRPSIAVDIVPMQLDVKYSNTNLTNEDVTVTIESNEEMYQVEGWTLSEDKKTLTKTFNKNTTEELKVYDYGGNEKNVEIKIENIDKEKPLLDIDYSTTKTTNQNVVVTINSNEEINNINGWTLSQDKKTLTKTYTENKTENIEITDLAGNSLPAIIEIKNIDKEKPIAQIKYSSKAPTLNDVIVTIEANEALQEVEGWQLSDDKKSLNKTYTKNDEETITVFDLAGNSSIETIKVENIDKEKPEYELKYNTTLSTNEDVTVTITASEEIQAIEGWNLSEDKKVLTKTFTENTDEEIIIKDLVGNSTSKTVIKVTNIDKIKPEIAIDYSITKITNQDVVVTITANEEIKEIETWNLSDDKKTLTKIFHSNSEESITIYDLAGNNVSDTIKISNIDKIAPKLDVKYSTTSITDKDVIVTITSDEIIKKIAGWTLSDDMKQLTKTFKENCKEQIVATDEAGNSVTIEINISNIDKTINEKVEYNENLNIDKNITQTKDEYNENLNNNTITLKKIAPNTGEKSIFVFITIFVIASTIMCIIFKKYKD